MEGKREVRTVSEAQRNERYGAEENRKGRISQRASKRENDRKDTSRSKVIKIKIFISICLE